MSEQIQCPVCESPATRTDLAARAACEIQCPNCMKYLVLDLYWDEFANSPDIKGNVLLSAALGNFFNEKGEPALLSSGHDVMSVQRGPKS